jgi:hypothetical protein
MSYLTGVPKTRPRHGQAIEKKKWKDTKFERVVLDSGRNRENREQYKKWLCNRDKLRETEKSEQKPESIRIQTKTTIREKRRGEEGREDKTKHGTTRQDKTGQIMQRKDQTRQNQDQDRKT